MATQAEVAAHLFLSDRSVRDLISRGVLPAARRGELDLDDCRRRYIDHLRMTAAGRARGLEGGDSEHVGLDLEAERAGLARAQKEAYELKNAATRLELLPKAAISRAVAAAFGHVRDRLLSLPGRLVGPLVRASEPSEVRSILSGAIHEALGELSEARVIVAGEDSARAA